MKQARQKPMVYICDNNCAEMDYYHCISSFLMFYKTEKDCIFSGLKGYSNGCSTIITNYIREFVPRPNKQNCVDGLSDDYTSHSLRTGPLNEMVRHPTTSLIHAIAHGNWDFIDDCNIWHYLLSTVDLIAVGGKALTGHPNSRARVYPPTLNSCLTQENSQQFENLINWLVISKFVYF
jgi:hypothetical protein